MKTLIAVSFIFIFNLACKPDSKGFAENTAHELMEEQKNDTIKTERKDNLHIPKHRLLGKVDYKNDSLFILAKAEYTSKPIYLNTRCYSSFIQMHDAAKADGIQLTIISGTRNFKEQKAIWERKWKKYEALPPLERAKKILEYSSMPTASRHHWGTDIDLNSLNNTYFLKGKGKQEYDWLVANAKRFGFYQVYTSKANGRTGYNEEKWHWSYLPVASKYLSTYNTAISIDDISRFMGWETAKGLEVIKNYVNGVSETVVDYRD